MKQAPDQIWRINADTINRGDYDFFVSDDGKYGVCFSNINEYGQMLFISNVQIWTDRLNPKLLFESGRISFEYQFSRSCYYFEKSGFVVLMTPNLGHLPFKLVYVILDFSRMKFAMIDAPNFDLIETDKERIKLKLNFRYYYDKELENQISKEDGLEIDLAHSTWHELDQLDDLLYP